MPIKPSLIRRLARVKCDDHHEEMSMRSRDFCLTICLFLLQSAAASELPLAELKASEGTVVVNHETANGTIICRDPQIHFDPKKCLLELKDRNFRGSLPEHMLVDMVVHRRLLGKQESYLDSFLPNKQIRPEGILYSMAPEHNSRVCGSTPFGCIQVLFDDNRKVVKYRARYYKDPSANVSVDSDWVQQKEG